VIQVISVVGSLLIVAAYAANQFRLISPANISYSVLNVVGSLVLGVIALLEEQWGFPLLETVWSVVSLVSLVNLLRGGAVPADPTH
jgi:hypothetical protein